MRLDPKDREQLDLVSVADHIRTGMTVDPFLVYSYALVRGLLKTCGQLSSEGCGACCSVFEVRVLSLRGGARWRSDG